MRIPPAQCDNSSSIYDLFAGLARSRLPAASPCQGYLPRQLTHWAKELAAAVLEQCQELVAWNRPAVQVTL